MERLAGVLADGLQATIDSAAVAVARDSRRRAGRVRLRTRPAAQRHAGRRGARPGTGAGDPPGAAEPGLPDRAISQHDAGVSRDHGRPGRRGCTSLRRRDRRTDSGERATCRCEPPPSTHQSGVQSMLIEQFVAIVGPTNVLTGERQAHVPSAGPIADRARRGPSCGPATPTRSSRVLAACHAAGQPVVTIGGLTGLVRGCVADANEIALVTGTHAPHRGDRPDRAHDDGRGRRAAAARPGRSREARPAVPGGFWRARLGAHRRQRSPPTRAATA